MKKGEKQDLYPRKCKFCRETYQPNSAAQKYCPNCQIIARKHEKESYYIEPDLPALKKTYKEWGHFLRNGVDEKTVKELVSHFPKHATEEKRSPNGYIQDGGQWTGDSMNWIFD